jgi:hypothetical protein
VVLEPLFRGTKSEFCAQREAEHVAHLLGIYKSSYLPSRELKDTEQSSSKSSSGLKRRVPDYDVNEINNNYRSSNQHTPKKLRSGDNCSDMNIRYSNSNNNDEFGANNVCHNNPADFYATNQVNRNHYDQHTDTTHRSTSLNDCINRRDLGNDYSINNNPQSSSSSLCDSQMSEDIVGEYTPGDNLLVSVLKFNILSSCNYYYIYYECLR